MIITLTFLTVYLGIYLFFSLKSQVEDFNYADYLYDEYQRSGMQNKMTFPEYLMIQNGYQSESEIVNGKK